MANLTACSGCNTCQSCNSCQSCNAACNGVGCNTLQSFCTVGCQAYNEYGDFKFSYDPVKENIMAPGYFDQSVWDEVITFINERRLKGSTSSSGEAIAKSAKEDVAPFKASEFNRVSSACGGPTVKQNDLILGSYFQELAAAVNGTSLAGGACDNCNASCNVTCNSCQKCNSSNSDSCGSGQRYSYCCSEDTVEEE